MKNLRFFKLCTAEFVALISLYLKNHSILRVSKFHFAGHRLHILAFDKTVAAMLFSFNL